MSDLLVRLQTLGDRLGRRCLRTLPGERGQTSSEYLLIAGVAVLIIIAVLAIFRTELTNAATTLLGNITAAVQ